MVSADLHSNLRVPGLSLLFCFSFHKNLLSTFYILLAVLDIAGKVKDKTPFPGGTNMLEIFNLMRQ